MNKIIDNKYPVGIDKNDSYLMDTDGCFYEEDTIIEDENDFDDDIENIEIDEDTLYNESEDEENIISIESNDDVPNIIEEKQKTKRGRKPKDRIYFGEKQELAVIEYVDYSKTIKSITKSILCLTFGCDENEFEPMFSGESLYDIMMDAKHIEVTNEDTRKQIILLENDIKNLQSKKEKIFNEILKPAFKKMVEAIIRGSDLYIPNEEFSDTYTDTLSHVLSKADKFDYTKGKRAYSYYSNVCKNYLIGKREKYQKMLIRNPSYDALEMDFSNDIAYSTKNNDKSKKIAEEEVKALTKRIREMVTSPETYGLKESEVKIGIALINLFENWDYVLTMNENNSSKLNKSVVLLFLREETGLDTKGIRDNLKKFKKEFLIIKNFIIS